MELEALKSIDDLMFEGVSLYENGQIHGALQCWQTILTQEPEHQGASTYVKFVEGHFQVNAQLSRREVDEQVEDVLKRLRGEPEEVEEVEVLDEHQIEGEEFAEVRAPIAEVVVEKLDDEEAITAPTQPPKVAPVEEDLKSTDSMIAQHAVRGPSGPRTQADGLSIQSLSRQLAELHRAGQYEQAVRVAQELLVTDPQHAVARRYIDEYQRQKQLAIARQRAAQRRMNQQVSTLKDEPSSEHSVNESSASEHATVIPEAVTPEADAPKKLSDLSEVPQVLIKADQISWKEFDHRAGFFLSQVDGETSYEHLIEISGMARDEAILILEKLVERGVIGT